MFTQVRNQPDPIPFLSQSLSSSLSQSNKSGRPCYDHNNLLINFFAALNILCVLPNDNKCYKQVDSLTERAIELGIVLPSSKGKQMPLSVKNAAFTIPTCRSTAQSKTTINILKCSPFTPVATPTHGK